MLFTPNCCSKYAPNPAIIIKNVTSIKLLIIKFVIFFNFSLFLPIIVSKNSLYVFILFSFTIFNVLYTTIPIIIIYIIIPIIPFVPYEKKKRYISFPDAKPAPINVPMITNKTFKISLIIFSPSWNVGDMSNRSTHHSKKPS